MPGETKRDSSKLDRIIKEMKILAGAKVKAGALKGQRRGPGGRFGMSHAAVLSIHEYGGGNAPARAPIRKGLMAGEKKIAKAWKTGVERIHSGTTGGDIALKRMGEIMVEAIQDGIREGLEPPLAESTKQKAGRDPRFIPLLDTEQLIESITAKVDR